jgi:undecaprenol kinase
MSMDSRGKKRSEWERLIKSFTFALQGFFHMLKNERNMQIHLIASVVVVVLAYVLSIPKVEKLILYLVIGIVMCLEAVNTAIERTIDLITKEYHPLAKQAKDIAAAAVFIFSIIAIVVGGMIFYEPMTNLIIDIFFK